MYRRAGHPLDPSLTRTGNLTDCRLSKNARLTRMWSGRLYRRVGHPLDPSLTRTGSLAVAMLTTGLPKSFATFLLVFSQHRVVPVTSQGMISSFFMGVD